MRDMLDRGENSLVIFLDALQDAVANARALWRGFRAGFTDVWRQLGPQLQQLREALNGLMGQAVTTGTSVVNLGNQAPVERYEAFGQTLGEGVGGGLSDIARFATAATDALTGLLAVFDSPTWTAIATTLDTIYHVLNNIIAAYQFLTGIGESLNPLNWLTAAGQYTMGQDVTAIPALNDDGRRMSSSERLEFLTGTQRPTEATRPVERPALPSPGRRGSEAPSTGRRGAPVTVQNRLNIPITVNLDGRAIEERSESRQIEDGVRNGELYTGADPAWAW
jgi:hypothetical protein